MKIHASETAVEYVRPDSAEGLEGEIVIGLDPAADDSDDEWRGHLRIVGSEDALRAVGESIIERLEQPAGES